MIPTSLIFILHFLHSLQFVHITFTKKKYLLVFIKQVKYYVL